MRPELHPACAAFPELTQDALQALADDIKRGGLLHAITMLDGRILDGKNRWAACELAGVEPRVIEFAGDDPIAFVASSNRYRNHLSRSQMAIAVAALAKLPAHRPQKITRPDRPTFEAAPLSIEQLSKHSGVGETDIKRGRCVLTHGDPNIIAMVKSGTVNVRDAAVAAQTASRDEQAKLTPRDVKKLANAKRQAPPTQKRGKKQPAQKVINPPYRGLTPMPKEDYGSPPPGSPLEDHFRHAERYGRVQLHPKLVKDMMIAESWVGQFTLQIAAITNDNHPSAEQYMQAIDDLLEWKPRRGEPNGWATDFGAKAKGHLETLERKLDKAIDRLTALRRALAERSQSAAPTDALDALREAGGAQPQADRA